MIKNFTHKRFFPLIYFAIFILIIDQISKYLVLDNLELFRDHSLNILPFFNLTVVWNYGISFGIMNDVYQNQFFLISLITAILLLMLFWFALDKSLKPITFGFVIGGAISNLLDRVVHGAVLDFIDLYIKEHHYPAFNIADSFIVIGILMILYNSKNEKKEHK